ncbi:MAG TPA: response regulator [Syntrophobacteraceae bacterium]|nr:response regulator [Syntrophobacteraceae bacterium]
MAEGSPKPKVLVVDDTPENIQVLMGTLRGDYAVVAATNGEKALRLAAAQPPPDVILLDIMMPGMDGFEVCRRLKAVPETRDIPVLFLSALDEVSHKIRGFSIGAVDYISKPFQPEEVHVRVNTHLTINRLRRKLEEKRRELEVYNESLEERVRARTAELAALNEVYERFVPREFIDLLKKSSILEVRLGDQVKQRITVMFADIHGWTGLLERMSPPDAFRFFNDYLSRVSPEIKACRGFIDQYYGDGIMALFPGPPDDAVRAAVSMQTAVFEYNRAREQDGLEPIQVGIGLHFADLMLGIIGNRDRMQGAVVGDDVNLASRIEGMTRMHGARIALSEQTLLQIQDPTRFKHRWIDKVRVKGRREPVTVYEVFEGDPPPEARLKESTRTQFEAGLRLYYGRKFSPASVQFNGVLEKNPEDLASRIYLERCARYMVNAPPDDWTGVESLEEK